jgi:hypothetical protein
MPSPDPVERVAADTGVSGVVRDGELRLAKTYGLAHRGGGDGLPGGGTQMGGDMDCRLAGP